MRNCFRGKKHDGRIGQSWSKASNVVFKRYHSSPHRIHFLFCRYIDDGRYIDDDVYFEDVKLQMESKLWAQQFNKQKPPKKIDIMQISVIQLNNRHDTPYFHMEHFIDGDYRKFNSNNGFVSSDHRRTPQAFSHFSFEESNREKMVVDIQGVNDLWTDPQIHSLNGEVKSCKKVYLLFPLSGHY